MSSNKTLNTFVSSAAALGSLYLFVRFMSSRGHNLRENSKRYEHVKAYAEFTEAEKQKIADDYTIGQKSVKLLLKEHSCTDDTVERILLEKNVTLRDNLEATRLRQTIQLTQDQIDTILRMRNPPTGQSKATISEICDATNLKKQTVVRILKEHAGYQVKHTEEMSEEDKTKLLQGKIKERNGTGPKLVLSNVYKQLGLSRAINSLTILRLFAEHKLNNPLDYSGSLTPIQQDSVLSHFIPEQTLTVEAIAEKMNVPVYKIQNFLCYNNIVPRDASTFIEKPLTEEQKAEIIRLLDNRQTNRQIADITSIPLKRISNFLKEYREPRALRASRGSESKLNLRPSLMTRSPLVVEKIMAARAKNPPDSFYKIADDLNMEMPKEKGFEFFSINRVTVRRIYLEQLGK